jgi:hypothetical protein
MLGKINHYRRLPHLGLAVYIGISLGLLIMLPRVPNHETDWEISYAAAALDWYHGTHEPWLQHRTFFNPPFVLPMILPLALLGKTVGYSLLVVLMLGCMYVSARILGGSPLWLVLSYPGIWMLAYGQLEPLICLGIALGWYALRLQKYGWLSLAYLLLAIKPQVGLAPALLFFVWTPNWRLRLQSCWLVALVIGWTFVNWGMWPLSFVSRISVEGRGLSVINGVSLWPIIGPFALALFVPAIHLPVERKTRLLLVMAANALSFPYSPAYSLLSLLAFPLPGWAFIFASLPAINPDGSIFIRAAMLLPLGLLILHRPAGTGQHTSGDASDGRGIPGH